MRHTLCSIDFARWRARFLAPSRHLQLGADVVRDFGWIVVNEMPDAVMRDAPEFGPVAQRADRRLFARWENAAEAQADDVCELALRGGDD